MLLEGQRDQKPWRSVEGWHCLKGSSQRNLSAPSHEEEPWLCCRNLIWFLDVDESFVNTQNVQGSWGWAGLR